jgi:ribosomal RNA-processing protein 9
VSFDTIFRWDTETGTKTIMRQKWSRKTHGDVQSHEGEVLSVAISTDMRYLASGGRDRMIRIHDTRLNSDRCEIQAFSGHRDTVTSLVFQKDSYSLFSGSTDRWLSMSVFLVDVIWQCTFIVCSFYPDALYLAGVLSIGI